LTFVHTALVDGEGKLIHGSRLKRRGIDPGRHDSGVDPERVSVSNLFPVKMPAPIRKLFAKAFGESTEGEIVFHPSAKCPECGSRLCASNGLVDLNTSGEPKSVSAASGRGSCNSPLRNEDAVWRCPNPDCPAQIRAQVGHWCSREAMDIAGGDAAMVVKLVGAGLVRDVAELYRLKMVEVVGLDGMNKNSAKDFVDAIAASRKRGAWRLLFGLGIPHIGAAEAQSLCRYFGSVDNVFAASVVRLQQAEGVSAEAARRINDWHSDSMNRRLVKRLFKAGLNFKAG
jgi:NAD-dependent DNA ligase